MSRGQHRQANGHRKTSRGGRLAAKLGQRSKRFSIKRILRDLRWLQRQWGT